MHTNTIIINRYNFFQEENASDLQEHKYIFFVHPPRRAMSKINQYADITEETFLHNFPVIQKRPLQNYKRIMKKCFLGTDNCQYIIVCTF